jgi:hypothetical protein
LGSRMLALSFASTILIRLGKFNFLRKSVSILKAYSLEEPG